MRQPKAFLSLMGLFLISCLLAACHSGTRIDRVEPNFGNVAGNEDVIIVGDGFKPGMVVFFGKHEAKQLIINSSSRMQAKTPSGVEGKVDLIITRDDGKTVILKDAFTYQHDKTPAR